MGLSSGTKLGPYEIHNPLGAGGMGEVYRARDTRLGRDVAIKVLPSHLSSNPESKERFQREARAISSLNHPNICTLHDVGKHEGVDFLVMEYLEGETLQKRLGRGALPLKQVLEYGSQVAEALDRAHQAGITHRDLKPGNIMLTKSRAKLLDFGLAKPLAALVAGIGATGSLTPSTPTLTLASMTSRPDPLTWVRHSLSFVLVLRLRAIPINQAKQLAQTKPRAIYSRLLHRVREGDRHREPRRLAASPHLSGGEEPPLLTWTAACPSPRHK